MKTRSLALLLLITVVAVSCQMMGPAHGKSRPVKIDPHYIQIPGTAISSEDQAKMATILRKYSKYPIYRVQAFDAGKAGKVWGKMADIHIGAGFIGDATNYAHTVGLSSVTLQIGLHTEGVKCSTFCVPSDQLVAEMTPVLQKYAK